MKKLYLWARKKVHSPHATIIFGLLIFVEAFFLMPVNTLLIIYGLERSRRVFFYATLALCASILGALAAYGLGALVRHLGMLRVVHWLISPEGLEHFACEYRAHQVLAVFLGGLTPIPLKIITLTAGFFRLPLMPFVASIALARFVRFFGLATALYFWGARVQATIDRYFYAFFIATVGIIIFATWLLH